LGILKFFFRKDKKSEKNEGPSGDGEKGCGEHIGGEKKSGWGPKTRARHRNRGTAKRDTTSLCTIILAKVG